MIIYEGIYRWSGKKKDELQPVSWWPGSYYLKIIDISRSLPNVYIIKPIIIIATNTGEGISAINCIKNLAKNVCRDFKLDISKVLWVEYYPQRPSNMEVAMFKPLSRVGVDMIYSVKWRPITKNELELIKNHVSDINQEA